MSSGRFGLVTLASSTETGTLRETGDPAAALSSSHMAFSIPRRTRGDIGIVWASYNNSQTEHMGTFHLRSALSGVTGFSSSKVDQFTGFHLKRIAPFLEVPQREIARIP